jgi:NAD(P)-dependent dehydrogenase (short-subunit alcohol dehydrogenase family)
LGRTTSFVFVVIFYIQTYGRFFMQFEGKAAIVTGGGYGIGKGIAVSLAKEGADVVVAARNEKALKETAGEIERLGRKSLVIVTDLLDPDAPEMIVDKTIEKFGKIDILVNNSGQEGPIKTVAEMDIKGWNDLLAVNLTGAMLCCKYALEKSMIPRKSGVIVNVSSAAGRRGIATRSAYSSSKFAMIALTQSLASEVGKYGIRVNAIAPGATEGERIERVFKIAANNAGVPYEKIIEGSNSRSALGRMVKPEEVGDLAVFLASGKSSAITGQTINIDAGANFN